MKVLIFTIKLICIQEYRAWQCHDKACITVFVACERENKPVGKKECGGQRQAAFLRGEMSPSRWSHPSGPSVLKLHSFQRWRSRYRNVQSCSRLGADHRFILFPSSAMGGRDGRSSGQAAWMVLDSGKWVTFIYIYWWGIKNPILPSLMTQTTK